VKARQADIGIEFQDTIGGYNGNQWHHVVPDEVISYRKVLREEMMSLNK